MHLICVECGCAFVAEWKDQDACFHCIIAGLEVEFGVGECDDDDEETDKWDELGDQLGY